MHVMLFINKIANRNIKRNKKKKKSKKATEGWFGVLVAVGHGGRWEAVVGVAREGGGGGTGQRGRETIIKRI